MAYKLNKEASNKTPKLPYYLGRPENININEVEDIKVCIDDINNVNNINVAKPSEKDYVNVIKKVKKENITPDNIGEIMLCQIPGISSTTALVIMEKYKNLPNLIKEIENNNDCLKDLISSNGRKINKTSLSNIVKFLMKK
jgi:hypothetical protein